MTPPIPAGWRRVLASEVGQPYYRELERFLVAERRRHQVFPPPDEVFEALRLTPLTRVRVVLLGQDPYPGPGQAHGLSFSVRPGVPLPSSLSNIFKELVADLNCRFPNNGHLTPWAKQGVLLLNTVLTVRARKPGSHRGKGWERFTDAIIRAVSAKRTPVVFMLWGRDAHRKAGSISGDHHVIIRGVHPSPMSAGKGFFGSRPFSKVNAALRAAGEAEIDWQIPDR